MFDPVIRALTAEDLDDAVRLSTIIGWNQTLDDWRMLLRLAPSGAFAAFIAGGLAGTSIGIDYGGFAWIAMMLVDPAYRGRGLGRRLLEAAMDAVPPHLCIRLDATPLGRPLYQRYGFEDEATLSRHVSDASTRAAASASDAVTGVCDVGPLTASDLKVAIDLDADVFDGTRTAVLDWALTSAPEFAHVARSVDGLIHYCLGRRGRLFDQIGPVIAGQEEIATALVNAALAAADDRPIAVDAFDSQTAFSAKLRSRGFVVERPLVRMSRRAASGRSRRDMHQTALKEFAIFGPEFA